MTDKMTRKDFLKASAATLAALPLAGLGQLTDALAAPIGNNPIATENAKPGTWDWTTWNGPDDADIEGYADKTSVPRGQSISFYVNTGESTYSIEIFRLGWYDGTGGRRMTNAVWRNRTVQTIPTADADGMIECKWKNAYTITVPNTADPTNWCSGYYVAKLMGGDTGRSRYIHFVVRDDNRASAYLYQRSVTTDHAYNNWGGKSLYDYNSTGGRAYKVSFNRPDVNAWGLGFVVNTWAGWEIKTIRFLEREGYDVTYCTNIDVHTNASLLFNHRGFLSVGHDEYWSWQMRRNVETALARGVNLAFLGANTCYAQVRFESSLKTGAANRTMVCYKEAAVARDPMYANSATRYLTTTTWRDPILNRPEDALVGVMFAYYPVWGGDMVVDNASHWVYAGTGLVNGGVLPGLLGYEADRIFGNAPATLVRLAQSPVGAEAGGGFSNMTVYTAPSGATVFATGSMYFSFGLDDFLSGVDHPDRTNQQAIQMMRNVLARFVV